MGNGRGPVASGNAESIRSTGAGARRPGSGRHWRGPIARRKARRAEANFCHCDPVFVGGPGPRTGQPPTTALEPRTAPPPTTAEFLVKNPISQVFSVSPGVSLW